ncbi:unnamed protein product, partial [marine sediment metagenome]
MASTADKIRAEIEALSAEGGALLVQVRDEKQKAKRLPFAAKYHTWYTRALAVARVLVPDRLDEFRRLYERNDKRKKLDSLTYVIEDYVHGVNSPIDWNQRPIFDTRVATFMKLHTQVNIIASCESRLDDILANIRGVLQAGLFDSELDAARDLLKNGHLRGAGAVAGVVLEGHLAEVCANHSVSIRKKNPHVSDFNDALKNAGVFDVTQWRWIQRLGDIRNLCDHKKARDPNPDEVQELLDG